MEYWRKLVLSHYLSNTKAVLCAHIVFLLPEQCIHQVIGEGTLASHIASVLQREKLSQGGNKTCSRLHSKSVFPHALICPVLHPCPQTSQLQAEVPLCQALWPGPRLIFRGGALMSPSFPCSIWSATTQPGPPAVFPFTGSKYYVETSKFQMG